MKARYSATKAILLGGVIAGIIDLGAASLINWRSPYFIMHVIAGGALGIKASFAGGTQTAILGFFLQLFMSLIIVAIFVSAGNLLAVLRQKWFAAGLAYGVGIFFVMNYAVVPLSAIHRFPHFTVESFAENMAAMLLFGVIVAFFARR